MSFANSSHFVINGCTFMDINNGRDAIQYLSQYDALGATHDSGEQYDAPKCHPETRKQLLSDIKHWIKEPDKETGIMYLHGPAGAGKSSIARSVCEKASQEGYLGASFFFWRGSKDRNNAKKLFTTIAYQLAMLNNVLSGHILAEIQLNPRLVYDVPVGHQFQKLIVEPCLKFIKSCQHPLYCVGRSAIIIDGLDECLDQTMQIEILQLLAKVVQYDGFPLDFFITSRPELYLQEVWDTKEISSVAQFISLSGVSGTSQDIQTVLESGFSHILSNCRFKVAFKSVHRTWPSPSNIWKLVQRSSGQFIYAATVMKFISSPHHNPNAQLETVLGIRDSKNSSPLADLDLLYHEILSRVEEPERTMKVLGYILTIEEAGSGISYSNHNSRDLSDPIIRAVNWNQNRLFLVVEQLLSLPPGEAFFALNNFHSLIDINIGSESYSDHYIKETHADVAQSCVNFLTQLRFETAEQYVGWYYAFFCLCKHIDRGDSKFVEISDFFRPLEMFISTTQQYSNHLHFQQATDILRLKRDVQAAKFTKALLNNCSPSVEVLQSMNIIWLGHCKELDIHICCTSVIFPLWLKHLKSYNNDTAIKRLIALYDIVALSYPTESYLPYRTGIIDLNLSGEKLVNIDDILIGFDVLFTSGYRENLSIFLSTQQFSGNFHCTSDDYADAHITTIHFFLLQSVIPKPDILATWAKSLLRQNPSTTPALLTALESAAQQFYEKGYFNKYLTHQVENYLLGWLKKITGSS